jgi:DNA modification methylase
MRNRIAKSRQQTCRQGGQLAIVYRRIEDLKLDPANARVHKKQQISQLAKSIETFGFNIPVVVDASLKVIAGHGRIAACQRLGWSEVPTISLDHLSEAEARAFAIADNRLTELSSWDDTLLGEQLKLLSELDLTFDLEVTGFAMPEIDLRIEGIESAVAPPAEVLALEVGPAVTKPGDVWVLGNHRICCGDARDEGVYASLLGSERAAVVFTDPPYNVPIKGHVSGLGRNHHREFAMATGEMSQADFTRFLIQVCGLMAKHSRDGALHFVCMDWRHAWEMLAAGKEVYRDLKNLCVWVKDNAGMGSLYRSQHELVFVFKHMRGRHRNNVALGKHGRNRSNIWKYPCARSFSRSGGEGDLAALHPTVKPVQLVADALLDCSERNAIVLDAFLGSGTTLIAAERTGRCCRGIEFDALYVDVAIRRWQAYTGGNACHAVTGHSFDEICADAAKS